MKRRTFDWTGLELKVKEAPPVRADDDIRMALLDLHRRQGRDALAFWVLGFVTGAIVVVTVIVTWWLP